MFDILIRIALLFLFVRGLQKGFLGSIIGPISLLITFGFCFFLFINRGSLVYILILGIVGPFFFTFFLSLLVNLWKKTVNKVIPVSPLSRIAGGIFSLAWGCLYLFLLIMFIMRVPSPSASFSSLQNAVRNSKTYAFFNKFIPLSSMDSQKVLMTMSNPQTMKIIQETDSFQNLLNNEKFKEILSDEQIQEQMKNKDIAGLLSNPKVLSLLQDPELLSQLLKVNQEVIKQTQKNMTLPDDIFKHKKEDLPSDPDIEIYKEGQRQ